MIGTIISRNESSAACNEIASLESTSFPQSRIWGTMPDVLNVIRLVDSFNPDIVIFATGSEVWVALEVADLLLDYSVKVVNISCWELFEEQNSEYKAKVLNSKNDSLLVSIEAGITDGWQKYTGRNGLNIGINTFGESAPGAEVAEHFGITPKKIYDKILLRLNNNE